MATQRYGSRRPRSASQISSHSRYRRRHRRRRLRRRHVCRSKVVAPLVYDRARAQKKRVSARSRNLRATCIDETTLSSARPRVVVPLAATTVAAAASWLSLAATAGATATTMLNDIGNDDDDGGSGSPAARVFGRGVRRDVTLRRAGQPAPSPQSHAHARARKRLQARTLDGALSVALASARARASLATTTTPTTTTARSARRTEPDVSTRRQNFCSPPRARAFDDFVTRILLPQNLRTRAVAQKNSRQRRARDDRKRGEIFCFLQQSKSASDERAVWARVQTQYAANINVILCCQKRVYARARARAQLPHKRRRNEKVVRARLFTLDDAAVNRKLSWIKI